MFKKIFNRQTKEAYYIGRLPSGLKIIYMPKKQINKKTAVFTVNYGSIDLAFGCSGQDEFIDSPAGVAHFLEHQLFKKENYNIMQKFASLGSYYNAMTGYTATSYFFTCTNNFAENFDLLLQLVFDPYFSDEAVEKERLIIEQEIKMYSDIPEIKVIRNLLENMYNYHPIRMEIGGTPESIKEITKETLQKCYEVFYHPSNMVAVFVGELNLNDVVGQITHYLKSKNIAKNGKDFKIRRKTVKEPPAIKKHKSDVKMDVTRPKVFMGYKDKEAGLSGKDLLFKNITTDIMIECVMGKSSFLYNRLYNKGIIDNSFSCSYEISPTYGLTVIGGESENPDGLCSDFIEGIKRAKKDKIKKRDVSRVARKYTGRFVRLFDYPERISSVFATYSFYNLSLFDVLNCIKKVSLKDVQKRLDECLDQSQQAISIVRPR